ncbi:MAG: hypothetical protein WCT04_02260 [Planctomycetota bacterium]
MTPNEMWLLDSAIEQRHSIGMLVMENVEAIFDRPAHGMDRDTLLATLNRLVELKLINATNEDRGEFSPTSDEISAALDSEFDADYGLTETGGAVWADVAQPDWNRFVDGVFGDSDEDGEFDSIARERVGEFFCVDKAYLDKFMSSVHFRGIVPHLPSFKWDVVSPWQALYWKELPSAHHVRFCGVFAPEFPEERIPEEFRGMGVWHSNSVGTASAGCAPGGTCGCG